MRRLLLASILGPAMLCAQGTEEDRDALIDSLAAGGYVVVFRHAHTDRSRMDQPGWSLADRSSQRNLSDRGAEESVAIGRAFKSSGIPVGEVLASPMFRTLETAKHAFGRAGTTELLRSRSATPEARELLTRPPAPGSNRVLVTHNAYLHRQLGPSGFGQSGEGDAVVVRPGGDAGFTVLGRIRLADWQRYAAAAVTPRALTTPSVRFSRPTRAMASPEHGAMIEPHLAAHPTVPGHLVGGVIVSDTSPSLADTYCAALLSVDSGRTWQQRRLPSGPCADPWVALTRSGEAVMAILGQPVGGRAETPWELLIARSGDGGRSWNDSLVSLGSGHDREVLVANPRPGAGRQLTIISGQGIRLDDRPVRWSVYVAVSVNAGRSFREPAKLVPSTLNLNAGEGAMLADGTILVSFVDFQRNVDGFRSRAGMLERRRLWMLRSVDGGRNFSPPMLISERCGASSHDVAADLSSGSVYVACSSVDSGAILVHRSDDQGESWQESAVIRSEAGAALAQPRLAINARGTIGVASIEVDAERRCGRPVVAVSSDSGVVFTSAIPLADFACPDRSRNGFAARRWPMGGDYFGWTADAAGDFHILWSGGARGPFDLYAARVWIEH